MSISERDLAGLALGGLCSHFKEKLESYTYFSINQLQVAALGQECRFKWAKETCESHQSNRHVDCESDNSDDEKRGVCVAELVRPSEAIPYSCSSLKPIQKNRQEEARFTFDVSKCDRIFDELLRDGNIKLSHAIPPLEELKRRVYCKWHNSFSHATNDCNIFRRQIQSAINEGRLPMHEMQVDKASFPAHTIDLDNAKVLIRPEQAEGAKGKNIIIGEPRPRNVNDKILARKVTLEKTPDGKESLKITVKASILNGQASSSRDTSRPVA